MKYLTPTITITRNERLIVDELLKSLKDHVCIVSYEKIDTGERRDMECTLDQELIPGHFNVTQDSKNDHILVWALDREAWRSFRASTLIEWKIRGECKLAEQPVS